MSQLSIIDIAKQDLYTSQSELEGKYPVPQIEHLLRLRDMVTWSIANPDMKDRQFVDELRSRYGLSQVTAYADLKIVKALLPNLSECTRDFHRWRYNEMIMETYQMAKKRKDTKTMEKAATSYAKFIDYNKLKDETLPANGGIRSYFGHHSFNHSMMVLSDMPQTTKGSWFLHYEDKMDTELIDTIKGTIYKIWQTKERIAQLKEQRKPIPSYLPNYPKWLDQSLNKMRSVAVYYKEYSTLENLQLLGEEYIRQMKRDLTPKTFQTSILCQKIGISHDGFYSSMQEYHKYDASDFDYLDSLGYDRIIKEAQQDLYTIHANNQFSTLNSSLDCRTDSDIDPMQPLCIGMDYNANINWIVCGQPRANRLNILKSFYVKFERKIPALVADFCTYYAPHPNKTVVYYYDATALGSNYAVNDQDFHWVVVHEFERHGWQVIDVYLGNPMRHDEKYLLINQGFAGKQRLMPYFNRQNNDDLILAVQSAGVERGRNGFRKNKSMEKQPESEEDLLEHRTDGTDAFDTLYIGCEKFPQHDLYPIAIGGVR